MVPFVGVLSEGPSILEVAPPGGMICCWFNFQGRFHRGLTSASAMPDRLLSVKERRELERMMGWVGWAGSSRLDRWTSYLLDLEDLDPEY